MRCLFLLLFIIQFSELTAQRDTVIVTPGGNHMDGSFIENYTNKWKVTYQTANGQSTPNKFWTDYGQIITIRGKEYFHRVQDLYSPTWELQDTWINMTERKSLTPVSFTTISPQGKFAHYEFNELAVNGKSNGLPANDEVSEVSQVLEAEVFDWNLYGMLLVGLPMKKGQVYKLPFFDTTSKSLKWLSAFIEKKESIKLPNGEKIEVWKVVTDQTLTFWISKSAPYIIRLELYLQDNNKLIWEVID